jgi:hypothetical protein
MVGSHLAAVIELSSLSSLTEYVCRYLERGLLARAHHTMHGGRHAAARCLQLLLLLLRGNEQLNRLKARRKVGGELGRHRHLAALRERFRMGGRMQRIVR